MFEGDLTKYERLVRIEFIKTFSSKDVEKRFYIRQFFNTYKVYNKKIKEVTFNITSAGAANAAEIPENLNLNLPGKDQIIATASVGVASKIVESNGFGLIAGATPNVFQFIEVSKVIEFYDFLVFEKNLLKRFILKGYCIIRRNII